MLLTHTHTHKRSHNLLNSYYKIGHCCFGNAWNLFKYCWVCVYDWQLASSLHRMHATNLWSTSSFGANGFLHNHRRSPLTRNNLVFRTPLGYRGASHKLRHCLNNFFFFDFGIQLNVVALISVWNCFAISSMHGKDYAILIWLKFIAEKKKVQITCAFLFPIFCASIVCAMCTCNSHHFMYALCCGINLCFLLLICF